MHLWNEVVYSLVDQDECTQKGGYEETEPTESLDPRAGVKRDILPAVKWCFSAVSLWQTQSPFFALQL